MAMRREASATWRGNLMDGSGKTRLASGAVPEELDVTWRARTEEAGGKTSPEELIAAAHATCLSMALSHALAEAGHEPEQIDVAATATFDRTDEGWRITRIELDVRGKVDMDADEFVKTAEAAKDACPVSNALRGNVEIGFRASLEG